MTQQLDDEACLRLLSAVVLHWWRECAEPDELARFLDAPVETVVAMRPLRIDGWRRRVLLERSVGDVR